MTVEEMIAAILDELGAHKPSWRRRWVAEEDLAPRKDRDLLEDALERLAHAPDVVLDFRSTPRGRFWRLKKTPAAAPAALSESGSGDAVSDAASAAASAAAESSFSPLAGIRPARRFALTHRPSLGQPTSEPVAASVATPDHSSPSAIKDDRTPKHVTALRRVFHDLRIAVDEIDDNVHVGPTVVRYRILPGQGTHLAVLRRRAEDISRAFGLEREALISNLPGDRYVALDVPRSDRETLPLTAALRDLPRDDRGAGLWIAVGMTPTGERMNLDLATVPHLLVAGAPGSGKTVWLQTALLSLALRLGPEDLEIVIIDPKAVDFPALAHLPHVRGGRVITEAEEAIAVLHEITNQELPARTRVLQSAGASNMRDLRARRAGMKLLLVVIDEFAELVTILPRPERVAFEREVLRLAQRARAAGIHLIIATQRPTADLIAGAIKTNLPSRISFRLPQKVDSLAILDQPGAENLLGAGDMLLLHGGSVQRLQGYFASMNEIAQLVKARADALAETHLP